MVKIGENTAREGKKLPKGSKYRSISIKYALTIINLTVHIRTVAHDTDIRGIRGKKRKNKQNNRIQPNLYVAWRVKMTGDWSRYKVNDWHNDIVLA